MSEQCRHIKSTLFLGNLGVFLIIFFFVCYCKDLLNHVWDEIKIVSDGFFHSHIWEGILCIYEYAIYNI